MRLNLGKSWEKSAKSFDAGLNEAAGCAAGNSSSFGQPPCRAVSPIFINCADIRRSRMALISRDQEIVVICPDVRNRWISNSLTHWVWCVVWNYEIVIYVWYSSVAVWNIFQIHMILNISNPLWAKVGIFEQKLSHWGGVTHICVSKLTTIGSYNGLSPGRRQAIIRTNAGKLLIGPLGTNLSEILSEIHTFSSRKCVWKCRLRNVVHFVLTSMCLWYWLYGIYRSFSSTV